MRIDEAGIRGFLHRRESALGDGLVLTHGAGSNANAPQLVTIAEALCAADLAVFRCDLAFRQKRPTGPPMGTAAADRESLRLAAERLRGIVPGRVFLGGHSYGGRQASMLAAEQPELAAGLLLLAYPLHPPRRSTDLRTAHFRDLRTPALFLHGTLDPFGTINEMRTALELIPAPHQLVVVPGARHDLKAPDLGTVCTRAWEEFFRVV